MPSYLLKVTKFLGKLFQFEFLVMTEKRIFAYKLFLSLNISDFNLFLCENCNPCLIKVTTSFPATPSKSWGPVKHPLYENMVGDSTPPSCRKEGCTHYNNSRLARNQILVSKLWYSKAKFILFQNIKKEIEKRLCNFLWNRKK